VKKFYFFIILIWYGVQCKAQTWNLIWSDEFDEANIAADNWTYDIGGGGWGNNELEYYTNRPENAKTENGNLIIIARKEPYQGKNYTSARLKTQNLRSFTYGRIEARIKVPLGKGIWPAFWTLGQTIPQAGWPKCGEIDIMEHINTERTIYGTMHWDNNGYSRYGGSTACDAALYRTYSIEWDANSIRWLLDGKKYWEGNINNKINSTDEFHSPHFIILNLAVGGNWPGNPDGTTPFPDTLSVDYVRVYQSDPASSAASGRTGGEAPTEWALDQNYPNPFNPSTNISFSLPARSFVSLKIFDSSGKDRATLVSEELSQGNHSTVWNADGLAAGVYFCRLQAGSFTETKKLVLLR
jgi:beta-glucanase (GH16 family)